MEDEKICLMNADTAFENKQYPEALSWYKKALGLDENNLYALSRAGAICVPMGKFSEALEYFERARQLDPENGDNYFNCGSAWFFNKNNVKAFEMYVQAEKIGCSEDVTPQLYYQMAMLCSMRQDNQSALVYFRKCQDSDPTGALSLNPDLISEKLKIYMLLKDFRETETCAAQLVAISPADFRAYMTYYSILMAHRELDKAEKVLQDAERYARMTAEESLTLLQQRATIYVARGNVNNEKSWFEKAAASLDTLLGRNDLDFRQRADSTVMLAEVCMRAGNVDRAVGLLNRILRDNTAPIEEPVQEQTAEEDLTQEDIELMMWEDMDRIQEKIDAGELDGDMGAYAYADYDELGNLVHYYDWDVPRESGARTDEKERKTENLPRQLPAEIREKAIFTLLSCLLEKDNYAESYPVAKILKHCDNRYYSYFGRYAETMLYGKLAGMESGETVRKYSEAIAFFRSRSVSNPGDNLAAIFRARLYAEQKKFGKAEEISHLLAEEDRKAVINYIAQCRNE